MRLTGKTGGHGRGPAVTREDIWPGRRSDKGVFVVTSTTQEGALACPEKARVCDCVREAAFDPPHATNCASRVSCANFWIVSAQASILLREIKVPDHWLNHEP